MRDYQAGSNTSSNNDVRQSGTSKAWCKEQTMILHAHSPNLQQWIKGQKTNPQLGFNIKHKHNRQKSATPLGWTNGPYPTGNNRTHLGWTNGPYPKGKNRTHLGWTNGPYPKSTNRTPLGWTNGPYPKGNNRTHLGHTRKAKTEPIWVEHMAQTWRAITEPIWVKQMAQTRRARTKPNVVKQKAQIRWQNKNLTWLNKWPTQRARQPELNMIYII